MPHILISNNHAGFPLQKQLKTVDNKSIISLNLWKHLWEMDCDHRMLKRFRAETHDAVLKNVISHAELIYEL